AEADPEVRDALLARDLRGEDLALDPAAAEPARDQDPVGADEPLARVLALERLGVDPVDLDTAAVQEAGVAQRLADAEVGVLELHVLADERDADGRRLAVGRGDRPLPLGEVGL